MSIKNELPYFLNRVPFRCSNVNDAPKISPLRLLVALALILSGCSGVDRAEPIDWSNPSELAEHDQSCDPGEMQRCGVTLKQANGVMSCFRGFQYCEGGTWGDCRDGEISEEVDPTFAEAGDFFEAQAISTPQACSNLSLNPCDPNCMLYDEDPDPDIFDGGGGAGGATTVTVDPGPLPDWSTTTASLVCAHPLCDVGSAGLDSTCHPCVTDVCAVDASCCDTTNASAWDQACVDLVYTECGNQAPPRRVPQLCGFSVAADQEVLIDWRSTFPGSVAGGTDVTFNSETSARNILSDGDVYLGYRGDVGQIWAKGDVTTASEINADQIIADGNVSLGWSAAAGSDSVGLIEATGWVDIASQASVGGDVRALGDITAGWLAQVGGDLNSDGTIVSQAVVVGSLYATVGIGLGEASDVMGQTHSQDWVDLHYNGGVTSSFVRGGVVAGGLFRPTPNGTVLGTVHAGSADCSLGTGALPATLLLGAALDGGCTGAVTAQPIPPRVAPTSPSLPVLAYAGGTELLPPSVVPGVDQYRRDVSAECSAAALAADVTGTSALSPGVYRNLRPSHGSEVTFTTPGTYVFWRAPANPPSWTGMGSEVDFLFDGGGPWDIVFCEDASFTYRSVFHEVGASPMPSPPSPERLMIYIDKNNPTRGGTPDGTDTCFETRNSTVFSGMILAPDCKIHITNGGIGDGMTWGESVQFDSSIDWGGITEDDCASCGGLEVYDDLSFSYTVGAEVTWDARRYVCNNAANCNIGGFDNFWPGLGANWTSAWDEYDDCPLAQGPLVPTTGGVCPVDVGLSPTRGTTQQCFSGLDCQVNSRCEEALTSGVCSHSKCVSGAALDENCRTADECVARICDAEPSCCDSAGYWDQTLCVERVEALCDASCGAVIPHLCDHDACVTGGPLDSTCDGADTWIDDVCAADPDCCSLGWDDDCVAQFTEENTGAPLQLPPAVGESICDFGVSNGNGHIAMNGAAVTGNVYADGQLGGTGPLNGNVYTGLDVIHTGVLGAEYEHLSSEPFTAPIWGDVDPLDGMSGVGCDATTTTDESWWSYGNWKNSWGNVFIEQDMTFQAGAFYVNSFTVRPGVTVTLPTSGTVTIYVCGTNFNVELGNGASVVSPGANPLQLAVWQKAGGNITFQNDSSADGIFSNLSGAGTVFLSAGTTINGQVHSVAGGVTFANTAVVNAGGVDRDDCIARGIDPTGVSVNLCPLGAAPAGDATVTETGTCVDNVDSGGALWQVDPSICPDIDVALGEPCDYEIPVCNHGNTDLLAGNATIQFFPESTSQFAVETPDPWYLVGSCPINLDVPAGACVNIACPDMDEDVTAFASVTGGLTRECSTLDNWTYYPDDRVCMMTTGPVATPPPVVVEVQDYFAECPDDSTGGWGLLAWDAETPGTSDVTFEARTSHDNMAWSAWQTIGVAATASGTSSCTFFSCAVDVAGELWAPPASVPTSQPAYLELRATLTPDGSDAATLRDWRLTYTCIIDQ